MSVTFLGEGSGEVSVDTNLCFSGEPQCAISYVSGSLVTLVADPQPGSTFDGFFGECFSSSLTCSFTITSDSVVEAIFSPGSSEGLVRFILTKGGAGSGRVVSNPPGIDCGINCSTNFEQGTQLTLTATPDAGSSFGGWQGDEDCAASMVLDFDTNCTAIFNLQEEQVFYLPHVADGQFDGGSIRTTFVLFNTGGSTVSVVVSLTQDDGSPLNVTIPELGTNKSEFTLTLGPGETRLLQTDGSAALRTGAATVKAGEIIGVSSIFSVFDAAGGFLTEAGVGSSPPLTDLVVPVDSTGLFDTGLALFNSESDSAFVEFQLLDESGQEVAATDMVLEGSGHRALFVTGDLFPGVVDFRGSLSISSPRAVAALTLRQNAIPLSFTTLPAVSRSSTDLQFDLPHVANGQFIGGSIRTTFVLFSISSSRATVELSFTQDDGTPLEMTIPTVGTNSTFTVGLDPGESKFLQTDGLGTQVAGAAVVSSDAPIGVSAIFSIFDEQDRFLTETGVGVSSPLKEIVIPVDVTGSFNTGIALFNNSDKAVTAARRLLDQTGAVVDSASLLSLGAKGHLAEFVSDIFPGSDNFRGSVSIFSSGDLAALTLRQNAIPLSFTTLPAERSRETTEVVEAQIGSGGGEIATVSGDTVTIFAATFVTDTNITVKTVSQKDFENLLGIDLESEGFSFVSALEIDSNGVSFEQPIQFAADAELFSADAQMIVVTVAPDFDGDGRLEMVFLTGGSVETGVALSEPFDLPAADEGIVIALLSPTETMGFLSGTALDPQDIPLEDVAIFELSHPDLLVFSDSQGEFALAVSISAGSAAISTSTALPNAGLPTAQPPTLIFRGGGVSGKFTVPGSLPTRPPPRPLDPVRLEPKSDEQANRDLVESLCVDPNNRKLREAAQKIFDKARGDVEKKIQMVLKDGLGTVPIEPEPRLLITDSNPRPVSAKLQTAKSLVENSMIDLKLFKPETFTTKLGIAEMKYTGFSPKVTLFRGILKSTSNEIAPVINLRYDKDQVAFVAEVQGVKSGNAKVAGDASSLTLNLEITVSLSVAGDPICEEISGIQIDPPSLGLASDVDVIIFKELPVEVDFPPAAIAVSPSALTFSTVQGVNPEPQELTLTNTGESPLRYSIQDTSFWLIESPLSGSLDPGESTQIQVMVTAGGLARIDHR